MSGIKPYSSSNAVPTLYEQYVSLCVRITICMCVYIGCEALCVLNKVEQCYLTYTLRLSHNVSASLFLETGKIYKIQVGTGIRFL